MKHYRLDDRAHDDLRSIFVYIASDNRSAASHFLDRLDRQFALLAQQPQLGEAVSYVGQGLRRISVGNYAIYFREVPEGITVVRVVHGSRDVQNDDFT